MRLRFPGSAILPLLLAACGPTELVIGDTPGVARIVAGVLGVRADTAADEPAEGPATDVALGLPAGVAVLEDGTVYFTDRSLRRLGRVSIDGVLSWVAGKGRTCVPSARGGDPLDACFIRPVALAATPDGALLLADRGGHRVYRYDPVAATLTVVLGNGQRESATDGAVARTAPVAGPGGLAVDAAGRVLVAETLGHRILMVDTTGVLRVLAGTGQPGASGDGGPATAATLAFPEGVAVAGDTVYVADTGNDRIRRVVGGTIEAVAGIGGPGFRGDGDQVAQALFRKPSHLALAGDLLFVVDRGNHRIRLIRLSADSISTWGGTGAAVPGADRQDVGRTALGGPQSVVVAGRAVFLTDSAGAVVRRVIR